nr:hypothetical protein [Tanacetum cinerariifolium]
MSTEMLQARENLMEAIQAFLKKYDQIPLNEKSMALLLDEERFLKIKQALEEEHNQPKNIKELLLKLINDLQILNEIRLKQEEQVATVSSQYWKPPIFYNDDDEESSIPLRDIISELPMSVAITPDLPIKDSLVMEDEQEDICLVEKLLYDNSSPRPPEELNFEFFDAIIESFSPPPIPIEDNDYLMEEIDIFLALDDSIPPAPRPPKKPPDDDGIYFDIEPDMGVLTAKVFNPELNSKIFDAIIDSFSPSSIPVEDSDYLMEEIDIFLAPDDSIPPVASHFFSQWEPTSLAVGSCSGSGNFIDAINHLAVLESLQSYKSSKLDLLPSVKSSPLEAYSRSLQGLDHSSEDSPSPLA